MKKKNLGVSNTPYDGGRWVTDGGWCVTDGGWCVTDGGWWVTDGGWWVTDGGWWVATKHQRVDAIANKEKKGERPYGTPCMGLPEQPGVLPANCMQGHLLQECSFAKSLWALPESALHISKSMQRDTPEPTTAPVIPDG